MHTLRCAVTLLSAVLFTSEFPFVDGGSFLLLPRIRRNARRKAFRPRQNETAWFVEVEIRRQVVWSILLLCVACSIDTAVERSGRVGRGSLT